MERDGGGAASPSCFGGVGTFLLGGVSGIACSSVIPVLWARYQAHIPPVALIWALWGLLGLSFLGITYFFVRGRPSKTEEKSLSTSVSQERSGEGSEPPPQAIQDQISTKPVVPSDGGEKTTSPFASKGGESLASAATVSHVPVTVDKHMPTAAGNDDVLRQPAPSDEVLKTEGNSLLLAGPGAALRARLAATRRASSAKVKSAIADSGGGLPQKVEPEVVILYGSQTGNAMEIAKAINAEAVTRGIKTLLRTLNEFSVEKLRSARVLIVVVSSTGDGDPPENAGRFCTDLRKKTHAVGTTLSGLRYTVVGLGDSNYTRFMAIPRVFTRRLPELGAKCFFKCCEADEVEGLDDIVEAWTAGLWDPLKATLSEAFTSGLDEVSGTAMAPPVEAKSVSSSNGGSVIDVTTSNGSSGSDEQVKLVGVPPLQPCSVQVKWLSDGLPTATATAAMGAENGVKSGAYSAASPLQAVVTDARCMTAEWSDRRVLHLDIDIADTGLRYSPGDSIGVAPENDPVIVDRLIERLGLDGSKSFEIVSASAVDRVGAVDSGGDGPVLSHIRCPSTVRDSFMRYCDIASVPKKGLLRLLAEYCSDITDKNRLLLWSSRGGKESFVREVQNPRLSLLDLLEMHPSCSPPLAHLLDALPPLMSRLYSITCSQTEHPGSVQVALSVVKMDLPGPGNRVLKGVCTNYLDRLLAYPGPNGLTKDEPVRIPIYLKSGGDFQVPSDVSAPVIMIGPGTGVGPFRGFLEERRARLAATVKDDELNKENTRGGQHQESSVTEKGPWWLFYGCRKEEEDFLYKQELQAFEKEGTLDRLVVAFSRATSTKVYVQHRMKEHGEELSKLILSSQKTHIFVCGDGAKMVKDVHAALCDILCKHGEMKEAMAIAHLSSMIKQKRYVRDIWS